MEIRDVFILRKGAPIYHQKQPESNLKKDETLTMGFLSALTSFATEIGAGIPKLYETDCSRFSFYQRDNHLFIVYTDTEVSKTNINVLSKKIAESFFG